MKTNHTNILKHPRITEKATRLAESRVYCFDVAPKSNKALVSEAVKALEGVNPIEEKFNKMPGKKETGQKGG